MIATVGVLWFLAGWSIRWGILVLGLMLWFKVRPPKRAATRHLLCGSVLVAGLALPLAPGWTAPWPRWGLVGPERPAPAPIAAAREALPEPILPPIEDAQVEPIRPVFVVPPAPPLTSVTRPIPLSNPVRPVEFGRGIPLILGLIWLIGSLGVLARLAAGWWGLSRLRRAAKPLVGPSRTTFDQARRAAVTGRRQVEAATHPAVGSPIALGGWSPMILLPTTWDAWPEADQRAALLHELAHIARGDDAWKLVGELIHAPFWFHHGVAWLTTRLDREAELAADEATVALGIPPRDLARLLLDCARKPHRLAPGWWLKPRSALSFFSKETVSTRINRLLEDDMPLSLTRPSKLHQLGLGSLVVGCTLAIGGAHGGAVQEPSPPASARTPVVAPPAQPTAPTVAVVVRDVAGRPIAGVAVYLRSHEPVRIDHEWTLAESRTDAAGVVRFAAPSEPDAWLVAFKEGSSFAIAIVPPAGGPPTTAIILPAGRRIAGIVRGPGGEPIAGAEVAVQTGGPDYPRAAIRGTPLEGRLVTQTGPDGRFILSVLPNQARVRIQATAAGLAPTGRMVEIDGAGDPPAGDLTLHRAGRVAGRVVTRLPDQAVGGLTVVLRPDAATSSNRSATTDAEGRFAFDGLAGGHATVTMADDPAASPWVNRPVAGVEIRPGQTTDVTVELIGAVEVIGSLVTPDGRPVPGIKVETYVGSILGRQFPTETTTDAAGLYRFRLPPGLARIGVNPPPSSYSLTDFPPGGHELVVPEGVAELTVPPIVMAPIRPLTGKLTDAAGAPIEGARVLARSQQRLKLFNPNPIPVATDAEGRFRVEKLADGEAIPAQAGITLQIRLRDGRAFDLPTVTRADGAPVLVKLPTLLGGGPAGPGEVASDEVAGVVVDPQGRPIAGVEVRPYSWTGRFQTLSDQEGRFRIKTSEHDENIEVRLTKEGWEPREILDWSLGEAGRVVVLDNRTFFSGRVVAPDGSPVANAPIRVDGGPRWTRPGSMMGQSFTTGQSGPDGRYRLFVEPGMYEFQVRVPGRGVLRLPGQAIGTDETRAVDLPLDAGITFQARLVNTQTGGPVAGFLIEDWRDKPLSGTSNADGVVIIPSMLPGEFSFGPLHDDTFARWWSDACVTEFSRFQPNVGLSRFQRNFDSLDFDLKPGMAPVTIQLEPAAVVRGVVLDPDGQPVAGATVAPALTGTGNSLTGDTRFSVRTDAAGKFTVPLPASGKTEYNLIAHDGGYGETRTWANAVGDPFATTPGQVIEGVTLRLNRPATVTGRLIDAADGKPIAGSEVSASGTDRRDNRYYNPTTRSEADGTFTLRGIRPGDEITVGLPKTGEVSQPMTLTAGETRSGIVLKATRPTPR